MHHPTAKTDAPGARRSDSLGPVQAKPFTDNQAFSASPAYARFAQELAYYRADAPYLTVEQCASRCRTLSLLLTLAMVSDCPPFTDFPFCPSL